MSRPNLGRHFRMCVAVTQEELRAVDWVKERYKLSTRSDVVRTFSLAHTLSLYREHTYDANG